MPLDGLSFSNSGMYKLTVPTEVNDQVKQISEVQAQTVIKKPEESEKLKSELESDKDQHKDLEGRNTDEDTREGQENAEAEDESYLYKNKYKVKFNQTTDMVELVDQNTGSVVETISSKDLVNLMSKSKGPSGILVDEKI